MRMLQCVAVCCSVLQCAVPSVSAKKKKKGATLHMGERSCVWFFSVY